VFTPGLMAVNIKETGRITRWMERASLLGQMDVSISAIISMIRNMVMAYLHGLTGESMMGNGRMENNTGKEVTLEVIRQQEKDIGKKAGG